MVCITTHRTGGPFLLECLSLHQKLSLWRSRLYLIYMCSPGPYPSLHQATQNLIFCPLLSPFLPLKEGGRLSIATSLIMKEIGKGHG